jgi:hypothetical protein
MLVVGHQLFSAILSPHSPNPSPQGEGSKSNSEQKPFQLRLCQDFPIFEAPASLPTARPNHSLVQFF